jgi:Glycine transporter
LLLWLDAVGLALVTVAGTAKGLDAGAGPVVAVVMGVLTAAAGGIIRDILGQEPSIIPPRGLRHGLRHRRYRLRRACRDRRRPRECSYCRCCRCVRDPRTRHRSRLVAAHLSIPRRTRRRGAGAAEIAARCSAGRRMDFLTSTSLCELVPIAGLEPAGHWYGAPRPRDSG